MSAVTDVGESARAAADSLQELCRATVSRPRMTPAEVDVVLGHLVAAVAALPQAARQLGDILEHATDHHVLEMDTLTETTDPALAVQTARSHLDAVGEPAREALRHLDAAHNQTAHIATSATPTDAMTGYCSAPPPARRPEEREPPTGGGTGPVVPR